MLLFSSSCSERKKYVNVEAAPVTTLVFFDNFRDEEREVIQNTIVQNIQIVNITFAINLDVEVNVTKEKVKPRWKGRKLLIWCGERNDLPDLYDELCKKAKGKH